VQKDAIALLPFLRSMPPLLANMGKFKIRFLNSQDCVAYRELRLQALSESPTAFASSFEQESLLNANDFEARLDVHDRVYSGIVAAFDDSEQMIGMLGWSREKRPKRSHIASLWSMYISPGFRRQGVGAALLDEALSHVRGLGMVQPVILTVTVSNVAASSLYKSRGFECFGWERDALFIDGRYFDEEHLVLYFNDRQP
jgi:ribosomal protein S18 acetylase RimI-like enzyme